MVGNNTNIMVSVKVAAAKLGLRKSQIKDLIKKNIIDWKLENGSYVVDISSLYESHNRVNTTCNLHSKTSNKGIFGNRVNFDYYDFSEIMINGFMSNKIKINRDCNFVVSEFMKSKIFDNETVIEHLKEKYKGKSEKEMIRIVRQQSLGFMDRKMPHTDYGFMVENINGETILVFCAYFPMNKNKVEFFVGLTYNNFKLYLGNPYKFKVNKKETVQSQSIPLNNQSYQPCYKTPHSVNGHWRNQPYGSRDNPQYKRIWISEFDKGVS